MNFIKRIFDGEVDSSVHLQFQKFSRGEFKDKAQIIAKKMANKYSVSTSAEFGNELVKEVARKIGNEKTKVTGAIVSTLDLTGKVEFKDKKQFQGVKRYMIDNEMSGNEILALVEEFPKVFFGLSFNSADGNTQLKIKPKAPKSGKPGKGEDKDEVKADFCRLKTDDSQLAKSFVFEKPDFTKAEIKHTFVVDQIVVPEELKNEKDFAKIRELSRRKGKVIRHANIDGEERKSEKEFEA